MTLYLEVDLDTIDAAINVRVFRDVIDGHVTYMVKVVGPVYRRVCFCGDMGWEHDADCFVEIGDTP